MRVLAINCGSSTLKFQVIETSLDQDSLGQERHLASGTVERIGGRGVVRFSTEKGEEVSEEVVVADHSQAMRKCLDLLRPSGYLDRGMIHATGHRVVHGGDRFTGPTILDAEVIDAIDGLGN